LVWIEIRARRNIAAQEQAAPVPVELEQPEVHPRSKKNSIDVVSMWMTTLHRSNGSCPLGTMD
jgi:hypothetical protein